MIELYLYVKIFLDYFPGRLKNAKFGELKKMPVPKVVLHRFQKLYRGLWFNRTYLPLFQNMSVKSVLSLHYLQEVGTSKLIIQKIKQDTEVSLYVVEQFGVIATATWVLLLAQEVKMLWKSSKTLLWDIWDSSFRA